MASWEQRTIGWLGTVIKFPEKLRSKVILSSTYKWFPKAVQQLLSSFSPCCALFPWCHHKALEALLTDMSNSTQSWCMQQIVILIMGEAFLLTLLYSSFLLFLLTLLFPWTLCGLCHQPTHWLYHNNTVLISAAESTDRFLSTEAASLGHHAERKTSASRYCFSLVCVPCLLRI